MRLTTLRPAIVLGLSASLVVNPNYLEAQTTSPWNPLLVERAGADREAGSESMPAFSKPVVISSLKNYFSVVGRFVGNVTVFEDSIVVQFDTLFATRMHYGGPIQPTRLDSIRVSVGRGTSTSWSPGDHSKALQVERVMAIGTRLNLPGNRFVLPHGRDEDDASAWLVVTFHLTVGKPGETDYHPDATTYAHSARGILAAPTAKPAR